MENQIIVCRFLYYNKTETLSTVECSSPQMIITPYTDKLNINKARAFMWTCFEEFQKWIKGFYHMCLFYQKFGTLISHKYGTKVDLFWEPSHNFLIFL